MSKLQTLGKRLRQIDSTYDAEMGCDARGPYLIVRDRDQGRKDFPQIDLCVKAMSRVTGFPEAMLTRPGRRVSLVSRARQIAMLVARETSGATLKNIGTVFGSRDHTTVWYGCKKARQMIEESPGAHELYMECRLRAAYEAGRMA